MKVLMQSRASLFKIEGGDTIQILKTKEYLERLGVKVDISLDLNPDLKEYDIVHLFHFFRVHETYFQSKNAKNQNKKVALTPIYISRKMRNYFEKHADLGYIKYINKILNEEYRERIKGFWHYFIDKERNEASLKLFLKGYRILQEETLKNVDILLPNSYVEMKMLQEDFAGNYCYKVIPNAVDANLFRLQIEWNKYNVPPDSVLCAARIEPRKNQLSVLKALKNTNLNIVLVGSPVPNRIGYYNKVKRCADKRTIIMDSLPHNELVYIYAFAKVHILASWFESPGLSSLEAASMNCNVVVSDQDIIKEYFKNYAFYCNPESITSIKKAVLDAYDSKRNSSLSDHILKNYTWEKVSRDTLNAYEMVLSS